MDLLRVLFDEIEGTIAPLVTAGRSDGGVSELLARLSIREDADSEAAIQRFGGDLVPALVSIIERARSLESLSDYLELARATLTFLRAAEDVDGLP